MTGDLHEHSAACEATSATDSAPRAFFRPKPDGNADPAGEAGWYLERERERRGLSLQTVSRATGVHPQHLRAIELGMLENLPERGEALRMIAAYARFLNFDPQPLVEHFAACLPEQREGTAQKPFSSARIIPFPLIERLRDFSRTPAGMGAGVLSLMLLFGGLSWALWPAATPQHEPAVMAQAPQSATQPTAAQKAQEKSLAALSEENTAQNAGASDAGNAAAAPDPIAALITRTMPDIDGEEPAAEPAPSANATQRKEPAPVAPPVEAAQDMPLPDAPTRAVARRHPHLAPKEPVLDPNRVRLLSEVPEKGLALRATEQIWLRLEDDSGLPWFVGFLKAGQVLPLPADRSLRLSASDVHRLEWYVNGQRMGRLGKRGADFLSEPLNGLYKQSGLKPPAGQNKSAG